MATKPICITLPEELIEKVDKQIEKIGFGAGRSGFIEEALNRFFEEKK